MSRKNTMKCLSMAALTIATASSLGGCQAIFGGHQAANSTSDLREVLPDDYGNLQLAAGRKALDEGRTSDAIDAFMVARLYEPNAAAAYNGLGVAYSRIGRADLAERFFRTAIAHAPDDTRYRANLATFYSRNNMIRSVDQTPMLAADTAERPAETRPVERTASIAPPSATVHIGVAPEAAVAANRLQRISAHEVMIGRAMKSADNSGASLVRTASAPAPAYPIRVAITEAPAPARRAPQSTYPVRIELPR